MKRILIIGFSLTTQYDNQGYKDLLGKYDKSYITIPHNYLWRGFYLIDPIKWKSLLFKIYIKIISLFSLREVKNDNPNWINFKYLKKNPVFSELELLKPKFKHDLQSLKQSLAICKNISTLINKDSFVLLIKNVDCAGYMIDSLQRFVPNFRIYKFRSPLIFFSTWLYIYNIIRYLNWLERFAKKNKIDSVVVNHQFYMESGFISCYLNKIFESKIIHFSIKNKFPIFVEPRVKWFKKILEKKLAEKLSIEKKIEIQKKDIWKQKHALFDIEDCSNKEFDKNTIVIFMHSFADANSFHRENKVIFSSYFQWIRETLKIAKKNKNIKYIFRAHPASFDHYISDKKTLNYIFKDVKEKNIQYEEPSNYSELLSKDKMPIFVTAKGNFSQELAIAGVKCIVMDDSSAPNDCCKKISSKEEYIKWLSGNGDVNQLMLSEKQRFAARLNKQIYTELNNLE